MQLISKFCPTCGSILIQRDNSHAICYFCAKEKDDNIANLLNYVSKILAKEKRQQLEKYLMNLNDFKIFYDNILAITKHQFYCPFCFHKNELSNDYCCKCGIKMFWCNSFLKSIQLNNLKQVQLEKAKKTIDNIRNLPGLSFVNRTRLL